MVKEFIYRLFDVRKDPDQLYMSGPIRIKWKRGTAVNFFDWHAVQDRENIFFQVYHIGPIIIKIGDFTGHYDNDGKWSPGR